MHENRVLAVFAHPDDEAFRCGGTLALLAKAGVSVHLLTFTRGQAGSCGQPPICTPAELGDLRSAELMCSCRALGLEAPYILDYEDGHLAEVCDEEAISVITARVEALHPQVLLTWPLHGLSGHPDHAAVGRWTLGAFEDAARAGGNDLASLYHLAVPDSIAKELGLNRLHTMPDSEITVTVNVQSVWEQKMAAIACHQTQMGESPILQAPAERKRRFLGWEHFHRACSNQPEDILLTMSRTNWES